VDRGSTCDNEMQKMHPTCALLWWIFNILARECVPYIFYGQLDQSYIMSD
jgi:hypothetical protein